MGGWRKWRIGKEEEKEEVEEDVKVGRKNLITLLFSSSSFS